MKKDLKILLVCKNEQRAVILSDGLQQSGLDQIERLHDTHGLLDQVSSVVPDFLMLDLETPSSNEQEQVFQVVSHINLPVAIFVDQTDSQSIQQAVDAGVSAYVVDGMNANRVESIINLSISRFNALNRLKQEALEARDALDKRKTIDEAKLILMKQRSIDEPEAYSILRKTAMNKGCKIQDIANSIITAADVLTGP